jgi:hypothetical protein
MHTEFWKMSLGNKSKIKMKLYVSFNFSVFNCMHATFYMFRKEDEDGECSIMRIFRICTIHETLFLSSNHGQDMQNT